MTKGDDSVPVLQRKLSVASIINAKTKRDLVRNEDLSGKEAESARVGAKWELIGFLESPVSLSLPCE